MPDRRHHRGPHPEDASLFAPETWPTLRQAIDDYSWLLSRGYAVESSLKLVGDRYELIARQRIAVGRCACSDAARESRQQRRVEADTLGGQTIWLDGYNVLTTIEAALGAGVILPGRDGTFRDMASMHGSYRKVEETRPALDLIGRTLASYNIAEVVWYLDRPVSNSGRLKVILGEVAGSKRWPWRVELVPDPDPILAKAETIIATADSVILDTAPKWFNLARDVVEREIPGAKVVWIARR